MPKQALEEFKSILESGSFHGEFVADPTQNLMLHARANISIKIPPEEKTLGAAVEVSARVFRLNDGQTLSISVQKLKITSVKDVSGAITGAEQNGFIQGANWILDAAKHALDLKLERTN